MGAAGEIPWPHQNPVTAPHRPCGLYWGQHLAASSPPRQYGTQGLFWRPSCSKRPLPGSTWESGIVSSACPGDALLFSACTRMTCSGSCHLLCAQAFLLSRTDAVVPSSGRRAGVLQESPPLCSHPHAPCPFSKGRGSLAAETSLFFFTVSDPIPNIPRRPGASTCSFSLQTVFYLGLRREEKQKRCMSHTKQFTIFIFPVAECCTEHTEALSN